MLFQGDEGEGAGIPETAWVHPRPPFTPDQKGKRIRETLSFSKLGQNFHHIPKNCSQETGKTPEEEGRESGAGLGCGSQDVRDDPMRAATAAPSPSPCSWGGPGSARKQL